MPKYHHEDFAFENLGANNIDRLQLEMIPKGSRLLEIGCATGYMSEYLTKKKGCQVTGVELSPEQATMAKNKCHAVINGAIDGCLVQNRIDDLVAHDGRFDVIFMSQVIEHLADPDAILVKIHDWIKLDGILVISTCNIAHWHARLRLLTGKWDYEEYGLFDRSHLRFFTLKSFEDMLNKCGFIKDEISFTFEDFCPFKLFFNKRLLAPSDILRCLPLIGNSLRQKYLKLCRNLVATQFVYKAHPNHKNPVTSKIHN